MCLATREFAGPTAWLCFLIVISAHPLPAQTQDDIFNPSVLHEIDLVIKPSDWATLKIEYLEQTRYPCQLHWRYQGRNIVVDDVTVHSRGAASRSSVKPHLGLDFNDIDKSKSFLGLKGLVLRNNIQDASMMRERLALLLYRRLGLPASRCAHARLTVNGKYAGLYMIVEAVDDVFFDRVFGQHKGYQYKDNVYPGGFFYFENRGSDPQVYVPSPFESQNHTKDPNDNPLYEMIAQINDSYDANFLAAVEPYLDVRLFIIQVAIDRYLTENDGLVGHIGTNNFYLYRFEGTNHHQFVAWDKSNSFISEPTETIWRFLEDVPPEQQNRLMRRALKFPELRDYYLRWLARTATMAGGQGGLLERDIEEIYDQIRSSALEDPYKQCPLDYGMAACPNEEFEASVQFLRYFARNRSPFVLSEVMKNLAPSSQYELGVAARKGDTVSTLGTLPTANYGYARVEGGADFSGLAGVSILRLQRNGIVVSESVIPPSRPMQSGRFSFMLAPNVNTAAAMANTSDQAAVLSFYFTDLEGHRFGEGTTSIPAGAQIAEFLDQSRFGGVAGTKGTFTFNANVPIAVTVFRTLVNERSEFIFTPLPVFDLSSSTNDATIFPYFADGGGWATAVTLINGSEEPVSGTLVFMDSGDSTRPPRPIAVPTAGEPRSTFEYSIPAGSAWELSTSGLASPPLAGTIRIVPNPGTRTPKGWARFAQTQNGVTVAETAVSATVAAPAFRIYVELSGSSVDEAVAITNPAAEAITVAFQMMTLLGTDTGFKGSLKVPANGSVALYLRQIPGLESLDKVMRGVLRISTSAQSGILATGFILRVNSRNDFLVGTTPATDELLAFPPTGLIFPYLADDAELSTQFVVFPIATGRISRATIRFLTQGGGLLNFWFW